MTVPTFVSQYEATPWSTSSAKVNIPAEVQEGDLGFIVVGRDDGNGISISTPAGWDIVHSQVASNSSWRIYSRKYVATDGNQVNVQFIAGMTVYAFWYRNANLGPVGTPQVRSASSALCVCPSITRTDPNSAIIAIAGERSIASTSGETGYTSVTNSTYKGNSNGNPTLGAGTYITQVWLSEIASGQAEAIVTWTIKDSSGNGFGLQIELLPNVEFLSRADSELERLQAVTGKGLPYTVADLTLEELKTTVPNPTGNLKTIKDFRIELARLESLG